MTGTVFASVLLAALLHAGWNALVKGGADKHLNLCAVVLGQAAVAALVLPFVPAPAPDSWPWIAGGVVLHIGYQAVLLRAYRLGDLSQVYPLARGSAPLIVALVSLTMLGTTLTGIEILAIAVIATGILSLALTRGHGGLRNLPAAGYALLTGCFIAAYSLNDGLGARLAGTALGFYAWVALLNGLVFVPLTARVAPHLLRLTFTTAWPTFVIGGMASFSAYAIVVHAFVSTPIALVTALRETSIVFALAIGVGLLGERMTPAKLVSITATVTGAALLRLA